MGKDYYKILGISKSADDDEIKKAYRKQAMKWHPDRNKENAEKAKEKFQEVGEAFEVLSDKNKRTVYDQFGEEGLKGGPPPSSDGASAGGRFPGGGFGGFPGSGGGGGSTFTFSTGGPGGSSRGYQPSNADDIFKHFFTSFGGGGGSDDIHSMFSGMQSGFPSGASSGFSSSGMPGGFSSGGRSRRPNESPFKQAEKPPAIRRPLALSLEDLYSGTTKRLKVTRKIRDGTTGQKMATDKILTINVKPGWKAGTKIRFPGEGDELDNGEAQDIEFIVEEKPHATMKRNGDDLQTTVTLSLVEALTGFSKQIDSLNRQPITVNRTTVTQPSDETVKKGEGMPNSKTGQKGDLVIKYNIKFPTHLTAQQKEKLKEVLG